MTKMKNIRKWAIGVCASLLVGSASVGSAISLSGASAEEVDVSLAVAPSVSIQLDESFAIAFDASENETNFTDVKIEFTTSADNAYYVGTGAKRSVCGIGASELTETVSYTVTASDGADGRVTLSTGSVKIADQLMAIVDDAQSEKLRTLAIATLVYGAEAQKRFESTATLADAKLDPAHKALLPEVAFDGETAFVEGDISASDPETFAAEWAKVQAANTKASILGASLVLGDKVQIKLLAETKESQTAVNGALSDMKLQVTAKTASGAPDFENGFEVALQSFTNNGNTRFNAYVDVAAAEFGSDMYFRIVDGSGEEVSATLIYSVSAYAANMQGYENQATLQAILTLGKAAELYRAENPSDDTTITYTLETSGNKEYWLLEEFQMDETLITLVGSDGSRTVLSEDEYTVDTTAFENTELGEYEITVRDKAGKASETVYTVSVNAYAQSFANVREVETNIQTAASIVETVDSREELENVMKTSPTIAIMNLNSELKVVNADGEAIATIPEAIEYLGGVIIPAFTLADDQAVSAFSDYLAKASYVDIMVVDDSATVLNALHASCKYVRGVIDLRESGLTTTKEIQNAVLDANTGVCILPDAMVTPENIEKISRLAVVCWGEAKAASDEEHIRLITAGLHGILTKDRVALEKVMQNEFFGEYSLVRSVHIIGHQGSAYRIDGKANTVEAMQWAVDQGVNIVEMDPNFTADGVIILNHDTTIVADTEGNKRAIAEMTSTEIKEIREKLGQNPLDTLEEVFEAFKDTEIIFELDLRINTSDGFDELARLINKYGLRDRVFIATGSTDYIAKMRSRVSGISWGQVINKKETLSEVLKRSVSSNGTLYGCNYSKYNTELTKALSYRGIMPAVWTPNSKAELFSWFKQGIYKITTDYSDYVGGVTQFLKADNAEYTLTAGDSTAITLTEEYYNGSSVTAENAEMCVISGDDGLVYENGQLKSTGAAGEYSIFFRTKVQLTSAHSIYVYTQPITVHVN